MHEHLDNPTRRFSSHFLLGGNTLKRVVDNYTLLTGRPTLLPKRALGYQGSSMYYPELEKDSDEAVLGFIDTVKEEGFPIDGFHLSSGYTSYRNKRCVFTWNTERFRDPRAYFAAMNERGAQNVPNVKPGVLLCHPWFDEFNAKDVFVKDSKDPAKYAVGSWWGGPGAFWDYTKPEARRAWKDYLIENVIVVGTDSIWNDNCEYDSLLDKDAKLDFDGKSGTIGQLKPVLCTLMCKIGGEAVEEHNPDARPYVVCRSGSAGIQKYAQTWCGDNYTSWTSLQYNIPIITGMGLSGQPNEGADIGGFAGPAPDEELFVRWVQNGVFQPRFSIHSASNDKISLGDIRQIPGVSTNVWALHDKMPGEIWQPEEIAPLVEQIRAAGFNADVVESVNVHDDIKIGLPGRVRLYLFQYLHTPESKREQLRKKSVPRIGLIRKSGKTKSCGKELSQARTRPQSGTEPYGQGRKQTLAQVEPQRLSDFNVGFGLCRCAKSEAGD